MTKILDWSKFKAFADENLNMAKMAKFVCDRVQNIGRKGENAGNQHFLLFSRCFQSLPSFRVDLLKVNTVW